MRRGHNEGTYYQLPNGKWRVQVTIDGKRIGHVGTRTECRKWAEDILGQIDKGLTFEGTRKTLSEFFDEWLKSARPSLRPRTWDQYDQVARKYIIPELGKLKLKDLTPSRVQAFYNHLQDEKISDYMIIKIHAILHRALAHALEVGLIGRNPADPIIVPKEPDNEMKILDESQVSRFLIAAKESRFEALYYIAVTTGMRQMEMLGLLWSDLDWQNQTITVQRQLVRKKEDDKIFAPPKTKFGKRVVALGSQAMEVLRAHYQRQQLDRQVAGKRWHETGLIFTSTIGTPMMYRNLTRDFKAVLKRASLDIRFHDLRHTAISLMLNHNVPLIVVSRRVGHANPSITLNKYGHLIPHMQEDAAQLMDELVMPIEINLNK
jgi:integrase